MDMSFGGQIFGLKSKFEGGGGRGRLEAKRTDLRPRKLDLGLVG